MSGWTDERVELLKKLWAEGLSASQIANRMGGVTRNGVVGKVHRMKLTGRSKPAPSRRRRRKPRGIPYRPAVRHVSGNAAPKEADPVIAPVAVAPATPVTLMQLDDHHCKFPIGEANGADTIFCGANSPEGSPYCEEHTQIAYVTAGCQS